LAQAPNFNTRVSIVEVDAQVIGRNGTIEGLELADFAVTDNRQPVRLRYCSLDETSLDIVLLFEVSRFMKPKLTQIRTAAEMAMSELREGDQVAVMTFSKTPRLELALTGDLKAVKPKIRSGLADATFGKEPSILVAADAAAKYLSTIPGSQGRRAVLIFTRDVGAGFNGDNGVTKPRGLVDATTVSKHFWDAETALSAMVIPNSAARFLHFDPIDTAKLRALINFDDFIEDVVEQTGGEVVFAGNMPRIPATPNPNAAFRQVVQRMRKRYRLYYDLPAGRPGQHRRVDVELSPGALVLYPDARMIARKGYTIPAHAK
jgi:VWFA-related protein